MIRQLRFLIFLLGGIISFSFAANPQEKKIQKPKLLVGVIVDQMRADYITRYWDKYGDKGFKRLVNNGYINTNTNYNYVPTYTAPGHASVFTGSTPCIHGIVGNNWYSRDEKRMIYCTEDTLMQTVGSTSQAGRMSPKNLLTTTIADQLKISSNQKSKSIGIALKDRGAILPAGHTANAAYWFDDLSGNWITSSYYMNALPSWVNDFNAKKMAQTYIANPWSCLLPIDKYTESITDDNSYESLLPGEKKPVFPHDLPSISKTKMGIGVIRYTPFGNSLTKDFAIDALKNEQLGKGEFTDFLSVSFSSTDYVGHFYGPLSVEVEDTYLRLDQDLGEFLSALDKEVGAGNYLFFLTADHGAVLNPSYLMANRIPAGVFNDSIFEDGLKRFYKNNFGDSLFLGFQNQQVYLDHSTINSKKLNLQEVKNAGITYCLRQKGVTDALTVENGFNASFDGISKMVQRGFDAKRCGDIMLVFEPGWVEFSYTGTSHGSPYVDDTHVPLIFYGALIPHTSSDQACSQADIVPTITRLLSIPDPNGLTGKPIYIH